MLLVDRERAQFVDEAIAHRWNMPLVYVMENAGAGLAKKILSLREDGVLPKGPIGMLLGPGHNGADGLVCARHLAEEGQEVRMVLIGDMATGTVLCREQLSYVEAMACGQIFQEDDAWQEALADCTLLVDGLAGTGLRGELREPFKSAAIYLNERSAPVVAIDIPTGVDSSTGQVSADAVRAEVTVTIGTAKVGHFLYPGQSYVGILHKVPLGVPFGKLLEGFPGLYRLEAAQVASMLPQRDRTAHKGTNGHVLLIGGSHGMWGAPLMGAEGAIHSGAGKTTLGLREDIFEAVMAKAPFEVMGALVPTMQSAHEEECAHCLEVLTEDKDAVAIGPGLGRTLESKRLVEAVVHQYEGPLVLDADALYCLDDLWDSLKERGIEAILTPHVGEFSRLTGYSAKQIESDRVGMARRFAQERCVVLVLKGAPTVVALPDGSVYVNSTGNPGMGTAGMGDILTGIITAFVGQGLLPDEAALVGVYLHGLSGDLLWEEKSIGFHAREVAQYMGKALQTFVSRARNS